MTIVPFPFVTDAITMHLHAYLRMIGHVTHFLQLHVQTHLAYGDTLKFYNNTSSCVFKDAQSHDSILELHV